MNAINSVASTESPLEARYIDLGGKFSRGSAPGFGETLTYHIDHSICESRVHRCHSSIFAMITVSQALADLGRSPQASSSHV